jgi:tRNA (guanine6-N2)-methyltransferase
MVILSNPIPADIFIDPMCGAGTIAIERAFAYPYQRIIAGDIDVNSISSAEDNIHSSHKAIDLILWNASKIPIKDYSIDKLVSNLPFGRQTSSPTENQYLYAVFFKEMKRIMKPGGKAVLLTTERDLMRDIISRYRDIAIDRQLRIELSGLKAYIYVLNFR